jgi:hypothetical protein
MSGLLSTAAQKTVIQQPRKKGRLKADKYRDSMPENCLIQDAHNEMSMAV